MFRLLYLAFFGEPRQAPAAAHGHAAAAGHHGGHGHDGHGGHLHDAPPAMAIALVVLAIGSVAAGYIGIPNVLLHGGNRIEAYLEPSFRAPGAPEVVEAAVEHHAAAELSLMGLSTVVAFAGIGLGRWCRSWRRPALADGLATRFAWCTLPAARQGLRRRGLRLVIVQPVKRTSASLLWRGVDTGLIDGTVNGVGLVVRGWSAVLRRLQTGSVRAYAMSLFRVVATAGITRGADGE